MLNKNINREFLEIKTIEFYTTGLHVCSRKVIMARAWIKHEGLFKCEIAFGSDEKVTFFFFWLQTRIAKL